MPSGCLKGTKITVIFPAVEDPKWTKERVTNWIAVAGGKLMTKFTDSTTHLVCSERTWRNQSGVVKQAADKVKKGERIFIVSGDWLRDTLFNQKRAREGIYSFVKADKAAASVRRQLRQQAQDGGSREGSQENNEQFVSEAEKKKIEERLARERSAEEEARKKKTEAERVAKKEQEALFRRGAKKAKNEIFSHNHHIYMDPNDGFKYEITLTKVDTRANRNERFIITLYETNTEPSTYATNAHFAGTALIPSNNIIAALGCSLETARHVFETAFREKTGVEWEDRISHAQERLRMEKRARGQATNSSDSGEVLGRAVSESAVERRENAKLKAMMEEKDFDKKVFEYHPPAYGGVGKMPEVRDNMFPDLDLGGKGGKEKGGAARNVAQAGGDRVEEIEMWMNDANGEAEGEAGMTSPNPGQPLRQASASPDFITDAVPRVETGDHWDDFMREADQMAVGPDDFGLGDTAYPLGEQQETLEPTQMATEVAKGLEDFMKDVRAAADGETVVKKAKLGGMLELGKRETSPEAEMEDIGLAVEVESSKGEVVEETQEELSQERSDVGSPKGDIVQETQEEMMREQLEAEMEDA
ncbi:hypothetical protein LTR78_007677 [Recurvomyces mirabilis]|uniref:BRCT domain-containing protein n=1 Tax=Recurvomyces mirabilis TaxID=574656 RepID=A0AAE0TV95_9PEZI|nr:hypothetical protein LTR78_007677 [Recurvomyces mirabilis]KAK5151564.1 hypothetical protein LTS14_009051 [Recurvomyces mirabilis]